MPAPVDVPTLSDFICSKFQLEPGEVSADTELFSAGLLDSFHLIELISHLEATAGIRVAPSEISLENLDTPARIARFVERKRSESPVA
jgi:acyl carrier protein